jgi:two-component sensor histidine kinase
LEPRAENLSVVRRALEGMRLPPEVLEDAQLLTAELVSNSIRHAGLSSHDRIHVTADWSGSALVVVVRDGGSTVTSTVAGAIRPAPLSQSGWGLYLVDQIATRWGTNLGGRQGYWFELRSPDRQSAS